MRPENQELDKIQLEKQKLQLEIEQLQKHKWKDPTFIVSTLPSLIAIISLLLLFNSNLFDVKQERHLLAQDRLELRKEALIQDSIRFEKRRANLIRRNQLIEDSLLFYRDSLLMQYEQKQKLLTDLSTIKHQLWVENKELKQTLVRNRIVTVLDSRTKLPVKDVYVRFYNAKTNIKYGGVIKTNSLGQVRMLPVIKPGHTIRFEIEGKDYQPCAVERKIKSFSNQKLYVALESR